MPLEDKIRFYSPWHRLALILSHFSNDPAKRDIYVREFLARAEMITIFPSGLKRLYKYIKLEPSLSLYQHQKELWENDILWKRYLEVGNKGFIKFTSPEGWFWISSITWFYALVRELKPERVVETGVARGCMTSLILTALNKNKKGELVSIDISPTSLPGGEKSGFLVPEEYKDRWTLHVGDAKDILVPILREKSSDIFIHDSLHTYGHMMWEYVSAFVNMPSGSIIISDDIRLNNAWRDFTHNFKLPRFYEPTNPNMGITVI